MINRDYRKEIGLRTRKQTLPWPVALLVLAVIALGIWWFASTEAKTNAQLRHQRIHAALVTGGHPG